MDEQKIKVGARVEVQWTWPMTGDSTWIGTIRGVTYQPLINMVLDNGDEVAINPFNSNLVALVLLETEDETPDE